MDDQSNMHNRHSRAQSNLFAGNSAQPLHFTSPSPPSQSHNMETCLHHGQCQSQYIRAHHNHFDGPNSLPTGRNHHKIPTGEILSPSKLRNNPLQSIKAERTSPLRTMAPQSEIRIQYNLKLYRARRMCTPIVLDGSESRSPQLNNYVMSSPKRPVSSQKNSVDHDT